MADIRELVEDSEEMLRAAFAGLMKNVWTAMPVQVTQDTENGHVATVQPTIQRQVTDPETGVISYEDHPVHPDVPIHHLGGGDVVTTHPNKQGDTGAVLYASRPIDSWFQSDGSQQPIDNRMHSLGDPMYISGIRSVPRMLKQVAKDSSQTRSVDKLHVAELHPQNGHHIKSADPSTPPASDDFDPFTAATKFFEHLVHAAMGVVANATDGGVTHSHGVNHDDGAFMRALNSLHQVLAHPTMGALLSASGGLHTVTASPSGVSLASSIAIAMAAPSMSLPSGTASSNIGSLGGDLGGTLPAPQVLSIAHVVGANMLSNAANDAAAATAGVMVGALYRNGSVLMVRVA